MRCPPCMIDSDLFRGRRLLDSGSAVSGSVLFSLMMRRPPYVYRSMDLFFSMAQCKTPVCPQCHEHEDITGDHADPRRCVTYDEQRIIVPTMKESQERKKASPLVRQAQEHEAYEVKKRLSDSNGLPLLDFVYRLCSSANTISTDFGY
jgi:hypothetical protein